MDGVLSAVLARRGFKAPEDILDENSGFLGMFSPLFNTSHITHNLGKHYHLPDVSIKPYAACLVIHPAIDGLICIRNEHRLEAGAIDRIDLEVSPICLALGDHAAPKDSLEAKFSIYYCAAVAILAGNAKESHFTDELVNDARIRNVMQKVEVNGNASLTESEAMVKVRSKDGTEYVTQVSGPKGDPGNPLDFDEVAEKFRDLSKHLLSEDDIQQIITMVQDLEGLDNLTGLLTLCCKGSP